MLNRPLELDDVTASLYNDGIKQATARQMSINDLLGSVEKLKAAGENQRAADMYKTWIAFNADHPLLYAIYFNYGIVLKENADIAGAVTAFRDAIKTKPDFYPPYLNLGDLFENNGMIDRAVLEYSGLINAFSAVTRESVTYKVMGLRQLGRLLEGALVDGPAEDTLRQALDVNPEQYDVMSHWISLRMRQCKWPVLSEWEQVPKSKLIKGISSLSLSCYTDDPLFQLASAHHFNVNRVGRPSVIRSSRGDRFPAKPAPKKLRIGYVSSDLREHAVGFSMTQIVELHNREKFEIFAYYCGIKRTDSTQARIMNNVDHWFDLNGLSDEQASLKIKEDEIDILIDLNGYTKDARTQVFSHRPAPIAVNWFGFPGTMGSPYHHYIIADPYIIPKGSEKYYTEKVVHLSCYQPNDRNRVVSTQTPSRENEGLPEGAFVYCCLNGMQKLTPIVFQRFIAILEQVPGSVLWLLSGGKETNERVIKAAGEKGIAAERLIFAEKKANPDHVARYPLADLFLDTFPYTSHTTGADSLWMGVPILTLPGRTFASRVCGSLVRAAGIPEMISKTPEEYVARAIELGRNPQMVEQLKRKLTEGRSNCLLFDTPRLVLELEQLFIGMWDDLINGELPAPDLTNLEIYHDIGTALDLEAIDQLNNEDYHDLYKQKLIERDNFYPLRPDGRLWQNPASK